MGVFSALTANFTIQSATGNVTGTKTLSAPPSGVPYTACYANPTTVNGFAQTTYQATIHTPNANYTDHGTSPMAFFVTGGTPDTFTETFASSQTQTTLVPTSKDQCKDDGWQNYPQFKNQGDCVSFVEHQS